MSYISYRFKLALGSMLIADKVVNEEQAAQLAVGLDLPWPATVSDSNKGEIKISLEQTPPLTVKPVQ